MNLKFKVQNFPSLNAIINMLKVHETYEVRRINKLKSYYQEGMDTNAMITDDDLKRNMLPSQKPKQIVDSEISYFLGKPISYDASIEDGSQELKDILQNMFDRYHEHTINTKVAVESSITGVGYELIYIDECSDGELNGNYTIKSTSLPAEDVFLIYSADIDEKIIAAVQIVKFHNYETNAEEKTLLLYDDMAIYEYRMEDYELIPVSEYLHYFDGVPITPYYNNDYTKGTFERVLKHIDALNYVWSCLLNEVSLYNDNTMVYELPEGSKIIKEIAETNNSKIEALIGDNKDVSESPEVQAANNVLNQLNDLFSNMRDKGTVIVENGANLRYITKGAINNEFIITTLKDEIVEYSGVPNLSKDIAGNNASGYAIQTRLQSLENIVSIKEQFFKYGLDRRLNLMTGAINYFNIKDYNYLGVVYTFKRNLPVNNAEIIAYAKTLKESGMLSHESILSKTGLSDDPTYELLKLEEELNRV